MLAPQSRAEPRPAPNPIQGFPPELLEDPALAEAVRVLPQNYNFEIYKTIHKIRTIAAGKQSRPLVCLQFPEGLFMFAGMLADLLEYFSGADVVILGDLAYGACCVNDLAAAELGADLLLHYGHSCLVPIQETALPVLYIFVEMELDLEHAFKTVALNFEPGTSLHIIGTIQFGTAIYALKKRLAEEGYKIAVPQEKPRSPGQVLGCTSPLLPARSTVLFVADGRFHLESVMIRNPSCSFYQYNPYTGTLTLEEYDYTTMRATREKEVAKLAGLGKARVCFIFGTLGRQCNARLLERMEQALPEGWSSFGLMVSEFDEGLLRGLAVQADAIVQTCCPRMSIDWLAGLAKPVLNSYEFFVAAGRQAWGVEYPMDYYSKAGGPWTNGFHRTIRKGD